MQKEQPKTISRFDYTPFPYSISDLRLNFQLHDSYVLVEATSRYKRKDSVKESEPLVLYGEALDLLSLKINDKKVDDKQISKDDFQLTLKDVPEEFDLEIVTRIYPDQNTALEGLYRSSGNYCTQCEAEGFRKITYYPDRPDVLTVFTTRVEAEKSTCPVLLSNGNLIEKGELEGGRHYVVWKDPYPKPCYLFALVAGDLVWIQDEFVTKSGKIVDLRIYVEERNKQKCDHAMRSLIKAMRWDEEVFGLEYDLDIYMIVAVDDFNMGAMENKGLNIFNSKYVLSTPESATDQDYMGIEGVIAHEYFHNWTGNRVTCRDWFQLSLKEGLTVFRDQEFSSDMNSRTVQRIDDVRVLKNVQFKEDAGPMSHPVRPDSYVEINNFYTATVYNKGAEVIRMMHTLLGADNFRKGMDLYFERHDGSAVTCDDFVAAMSDASGIDLDQFKLWYAQSGTPEIAVKSEWDEQESEFKLTLQQHCPSTPGQAAKRPFHIPVSVGLLGPDGRDLLLPVPTQILKLQEQQQIFVFQGIDEKPTVSFLRDFSAPVKIRNFQSREELAFLLSNDSNLYNRWDAATKLATGVILEVADQLSSNQSAVVDELYLEAVKKNIETSTSDPALLALTLQLPGETTIAQEMDVIRPDELHEARKFIKLKIAQMNTEQFLDIYDNLSVDEEYSLSPEAIGGRSLKNTVLSYLMSLQPLSANVLEICAMQYYQATNMTDTIAALSCFTEIDSVERGEVLNDFYQKWQNDPLVLDKWFAIQAVSALPETLERVIGLMDNPSFSLNNPNKVRSLIGTFCSVNHVRFHADNGAGYRFLGDNIVRLNKLNPQIAARMVTPLVNWKRYDEKRKELMRFELEMILKMPGISKDVYEIVSKSL